MKEILLGLLLGASALFGQNALWIDLSGEWRQIVGQDRPEFAAPDFDDSHWASVKLPAGSQPGIASGWLRKNVELPDGTDPTQLVLTLGAFRRRYEVYVNGAHIGSTGSFVTNDDLQISRPRTFALPSEAVRKNGTVLIALRIGPSIPMHPVFRVANRGPYLLTYRAQAPVEAGLQALERHKLENTPALLFAFVFLGMAGLSFLGWLAEKRRMELLWFALMSLTRSVEWLDLLAQLTPDSYPFVPGREMFHVLLAGFVYPAYGEVVLHSVGYRRGWLRWALWLGWAIAPVTYLFGEPLYPSFYFTNAWCTLLPLGVILWDWRTVQGRGAPWGEQAIRVALILPLLQNLDFWVGQLGRVRNLMPQLFFWAGYRFFAVDVFWMAVCAVILWLIVRRVAADRREKQSLEGELEAARTVQQLLLPQSRIASAAYEVDAIYEPALQVGGDFHWNRVAPDGSLILVVGDVSGKGLRAAMLVSVAVGILRNEKSDSPATILAALNQGLTGHTGGGFVTCCCTRFSAGGAVTLANAGHPAPYCDGRELEVEAGLPLGIVAGAAYAETVVNGSRYTYVSDGVVEAANAKGELFGFDRTREISTQSVSAIAKTAKAWGQNDDITVVTVRRTL